MSYKVSPEHHEKILLAISKAREPGACRYEDNGPCCVIGQLHAIEGGKAEERELWDHAFTGKVSCPVNELDNFMEDDPPHFPDYDMELLTEIQIHWDNTPYASADIDTARSNLRAHYESLLVE